MKIIRTFLSTDYASFPSVQGLELKANALQVKVGFDYGIISYPLVYPRLATRFFGFGVTPSSAEDSIGIAVWGTNNGETGYFAFQTGYWILVDAPVYHSVEQMRDAIAKWIGSIKFELKLTPEAIIAELAFGYEVDLEISEYLLRFALPAYLKKEYKVSLVARSDSLGRVPLPTGFLPHKIKDVYVQFLDQLPQPASLSGEMVIPSTNKPRSELQVSFKIVPLVDFARGLYQVEEIPTIAIRELPVKNYVSTYRQDIINSSNNGFEVDRPSSSFDLPVELLVMAPRMSTAKAIAKQIIEMIQRDSKIFIPPIDMYVGCLVLGSGELQPIEFEGGEGNDPVDNVKGKLSTMIVKICLKRLDF